MVVRDRLTGAEIRWSGHPHCAGYAMPLAAAHPTRCVGRRLAMPEHPNCAVLFDNHICVAAVGWDAISLQLHRFSAATLEYVDTPINHGRYSTSPGSVEERQIPVFHRVPQIAATANNLYSIANNGTQGAYGAWVFRRLAKGSATPLSPITFDMTNAAHWAGGVRGKIGGSNAVSGYYYGARAVMTGESTERVFISGLVNTADGKAHAAVMYSDDLYATGTGQAATWTLVPILTGGVGDGPTMTHVAAHDDLLVGVVTRVYSRDWVNVVWSDDFGATWHIAGVATEGDHQIVGELAASHAAATSRQLLQQAGKTFSVVRVIYDPAGQKAYVSLVVADSAEGYGGNCESPAGCFILEADLSDREGNGSTQTLHGPFFESERRAFDNGIQLIDPGGVALRAIVAAPEPGPEVAGYIDQADGGPTLLVYEIPKDDIGDFQSWVQPPLQVRLPSGGSTRGYVDSASEGIAHEWGYGHHQCFNGISVVDGAPNVAYVLVSDQRVTGAKQCFHMARIGLLNLTTGNVHVAGSTGERGQIVVPSNVGIAGGYRGVPFLGVRDWDERLDVGDGALSIVAVLNLAGSIVGGPTMPTLSGNDRFGMPLLVFAEMQPQTVSAAPRRNCPRNGWGLFQGYELHFWMFDGCPGSNDPDAATYRVLRVTQLAHGTYAGQWARVCIVKEASATGSGSFRAYLNGASTSMSQYGSALRAGDVAPHAKLRFFHLADSFGEIISQASPAAGMWVYDRALTATEAQNVTKWPGAAGQMGPEDPSLLGNLVARTYGGVGDWQAMGARGGGLTAPAGLRTGGRL